MRSTLLIAAISLSIVMATAAYAQNEQRTGLTVTGQGEVAASPDTAMVRLGAVAQSETAAQAQQEVNRVVQAALTAIKGLGIPEKNITTVGINLHPVYSQRRPQDESYEQRIIAYRAQNTIQVETDDLSKIGPVIDAGVKSGANNVENIAFRLRDDSQEREEALRLAVQEARAKAQTIAAAAGMRLEAPAEINEGGVSIFLPKMEFGRAGGLMAADMATPVEPGQVRVNASVSIRYQMRPQ